MQRRIVSTVHDVNASPPHDEHVHHTGAALPACPVERAEAVVISTVRKKCLYSAQVSQKKLQHSKDRQEKYEGEKKSIPATVAPRLST